MLGGVCICCLCMSSIMMSMSGSEDKKQEPTPGTLEQSEDILDKVSADLPVDIPDIDSDEDTPAPEESEPAPAEFIPHQINLAGDWCGHEGAVHQDVPGCGRICSDTENVGQKDLGAWGTWESTYSKVDRACPEAQLDKIWKDDGGKKKLVIGSPSTNSPVPAIAESPSVVPSNIEEKSMEDAVPIVSSLFDPSSFKNTDVNNNNSKKLMDVAVNARRELISNLANVDEIMEDLYLHATLEQDDGSDENIEDYITTDEIKASIQRMTLQRKVMPTLCGAALRGVGVEPLLDCVAEYCKFA